MAASSLPGDVAVWDTGSARIVFAARRAVANAAVVNVAFVAGGGLPRIAYLEGGQVVVESWGATRAPRRLRHPAGLRGLAVHPRRGTLVGIAGDGSLIAWDADTGKESFRRDFAGAGLTALAMSADGDALAVAASDKSVRLLDARTGADRSPLAGHGGAILALAFSPDGEFLAGGSSAGTFHVWDLMRGGIALEGTMAEEVLGVAFSADGRRLALADRKLADRKGVVQIWDVTARTKRAALTGSFEPRLPLAFQPGGRRLAYTADSGLLLIWDGVSSQRAHALDAHHGEVTCVAFSPDGRRLASADRNGSVHLCDPDDGRVFLTLAGEGSPAVGLAFGANGRFLVSAHEDGTIRIWEGTP
jgi:WD40 repeat protein